MAYIELETAIKVLRGEAIAKYPASFYMGLFAASNELNNISPADVAPVRHGRWELTGTDKRGRGGNWKCTGRDGCGKSYPYRCDYCPNCGCKMDLED